MRSQEQELRQWVQRLAEDPANAGNPLLAGLRARPRPVTGRCGACRHLDICNGSSRVRAFRAEDDHWAADPGCYLTDAEIGLDPAEEGTDVLAHA